MRMIEETVKNETCQRCLEGPLEDMVWYGEEECPRIDECVRWQRAGFTVGEVDC